MTVARIITKTTATPIPKEELTFLESNPYYQNSKSVFYPCIESCVECENGNTCITCINNYKVDEMCRKNKKLSSL